MKRQNNQTGIRTVGLWSDSEPHECDSTNTVAALEASAIPSKISLTCYADLHKANRDIILNRITNWIESNITHNPNQLPKTRVKFCNAIKPMCCVKQSISTNDVIVQLYEDRCFGICSICGQFYLHTAMLQSNNTNCPFQELRPLISQVKSKISKLGCAPKSLQTFINIVDNFDTKTVYDTNEIWEGLTQHGIVTCDDTSEQNLTYNSAKIQEFIEKYQQQQEENMQAADNNNSNNNTNENNNVNNNNNNNNNDSSSSNNNNTNPAPVGNFDDMGLVDNLLRGIYSYGFEKPSIIQSKVIPVILSNKDVVFNSMSGSGKTAAFVIPILNKVDTNKKKTQIVILVPTRELAQQVAKVVSDIGDFLNVSVHTIVGGLSVGADIRAIKKGAQVVVGTVGRILDMIKRKALSTKLVHTIVLDEADELLSRSTRDQMYDFFQEVPTKAQVVLCGSTVGLDDGMMELAGKITSSAVEILEPQRKDLFPSNLKLFYIDVDKEDWKLDTLCDLYDTLAIAQAIVFCNTRRKIDWLTEQMRQRDYTVSATHGDMNQNDRDIILSEFRSGSSRFLIAGNQMARGIDNHCVNFIVNYDFPTQREDFLHRAGRAARFGRNGICITFVTADCQPQLEECCKFYGIKVEEMPANMEELCKKLVKGQ